MGCGHAGGRSRKPRGLLGSRQGRRALGASHPDPPEPSRAPVALSGFGVFSRAGVDGVRLVPSLGGTRD